MKKIGILVAGLVILSACKKDYTCVCSVAGTQVSSTTINDTKSKATKECDDGDGTATIPGFGTITSECEIQ